MLRLGFSNEYHFTEKDEHGVEQHVTVFWRMPTTAERVRYLIEASKISLKPEDRDATLVAAAEMQEKYGRMVITGIEGIEVPADQNVITVFVQQGGDHVGKVIAAAFAQGKEVEAVEGKSVAE